ncbi:hypothetical protein A2U01_0067597, partial [Trifolium medium]|nr:hypothetical protein [Trifolium medium]
MKEKFGHAVDRLVKIVQEKIEERGMEALKLMMESVERCKVKRLTLTPHHYPRVEEFVVNEVLSLFNQTEEEEVKAEEEEKKRQIEQEE